MRLIQWPKTGVLMLSRCGPLLWQHPTVIALSAGLLSSCGPAPLNWWWVAWVSLIPLWWIVLPCPAVPRMRDESDNQRSMMWPLILWGVAYHGISLSWITGLHPLTWLGVSWPASVAIVGFAWAFVTGWGIASVLLWGYGLRWLDQQFTLNPYERILAGTTLWCVIEAIRSQTPLDWTALSYTQSPGNLWILHLGQLSGNLTVSAVIVAVNGLISEALRPNVFQRTGRDRIRAKYSWRSRLNKPLLAAGTTLIVSHSIGAILYFQPLNDASAAALNIGIIQGNIPTRIKLSAAGVQQAIRHYTIGYRDLAQQGVDAVLTPEAALPFSWTQQPSTGLMQSITKAKVPLWLGSFGQAIDNEHQSQPTQRLFSLDAAGQVISYYDKVKLVPLGESLPLEPLLSQVIGHLLPIQSFLHPGTIGQIFETGFGRAAIGICYESAFPDIFAAQVKQGANLIITASNLDPYGQILMAQHEAHDLMRAIENDRWAIRATNTGYSGIINPHGQIIWKSTPHTFIRYHDRVYRRYTQTLYIRLGNWLTPCLLVGLGIQLGRKSIGST